MSGVPVGDGKLTEKDRVDLLKTEYFKLQETIESFDERALQIKGWSVTVSLAGMAAALIADIDARTKALAFAVAAAAAFGFWLIEFAWKSFQWSFYPRVKTIERAFVGFKPTIDPLQIHTSFGETKEWDRIKSLPKLFFPFIMLPHILIVAAGIALSCYFWQMPTGVKVAPDAGAIDIHIGSKAR
jgi:hypothetical protein